MKCQY